MEFVLALTFLTEGGLKSNFSISGVKPDITNEEVNGLMDLIIEKDVFFTASGGLKKKSGAQITERKITKFQMI